MINPKQLLKRLNPKPNIEIDRAVVEVTNSIKNLISHCLHLPLPSPDVEAIKDHLMKIEMQKHQYVELWNSALSTQLMNFINRIHNVLTIYQESSCMEVIIADSVKLNKISKLVMSALAKLMQCAKAISQILKHNQERLGWCKCMRDRCPCRFNPCFLERKLYFSFVNDKKINVSHIDMQWAIVCLQKASLFDLSDYEQALENNEYLGMVGDIECDILSVEEHIRPEHELIIEDLSAMKIKKDQREKCAINQEWIEGLKGRLYNR